ncbi:hypothetical protein ACFQZ2_02745 [Streptomonospora algeriensis]|uniref:Uncharacterized protein n=1 Tax=Streptomonospora algeriensis TaxID=995084 RepID=A0ABW3BAK0_9ACTN
MSQQFLLVANDTDRLAQELAAVARSEGQDPLLRDLTQASRMFSISVEARSCTITPDLPLFLRAPLQRARPQEFRQSFHSLEHTGTLWAVASLIESPCVNRPTPRGFVATSPSACITELRAGFPESATPPELFMSDPLSAEADGSLWCQQDTGTGHITRSSEVPVGQGPYRMRQRNPEAAYETVIVVDNDAWRTSTEPLSQVGDLEECSIGVAAQLGLTFAAVLWALDPEGEKAVLARVDPYPGFDQVLPVWTEAATALLKVLMR